MIKLPDQTVTMIALPTVTFVNRPASMDSWQVNNVNGLFTIFFRDYSNNGQLGTFQQFPDGSYNLSERYIQPYGVNDGFDWFYADGVLFTNTNINRSTAGCKLTSFAYDLFDGSIIGAQSGDGFGAYGFGPGNWCFGAIYSGANYYPAFSNGVPYRLYGNAWSSGQVSGYAGSGSIYSTPELSYKNYTSSKVNIEAYSDWWRNPSAIGSNTQDIKNLAAFGGGYIMMGRGNGYYNQVPLGIDVGQLNVVTDSFTANCAGNDLLPIIDVLNSINIMKYYPGEGLWYGPHFIFQPQQNTLSCSIQGGSPTRQHLFLMDLQGNFIKHVYVNGVNWNWFSWMDYTGFVYSVWYDGNKTMYMYKSTSAVDLSYSITVPSRPGPVIKTPATDTRAFYKSK